MAITPLDKNKVMRPALIDVIDKINEVITGLTNIENSISQYVDLTVNISEGPYPEGSIWYYGNATLPVERSRIMSVTPLVMPNLHPGIACILNSVIRVWSSAKGTATIRVVYK